MAADCRLAADKKAAEGGRSFWLGKVIRTNGQQWDWRSPFVYVFVIFLVVSDCQCLFLNCDTVKSCTCEKGDFGGWRIECPNDRYNSYPVTISDKHGLTMDRFQKSISDYGYDIDGYLSDAPFITISLRVQKTSRSSYQEAYLEITCDTLHENVDPWSYIKGIDLSVEQVYAKIVWLEIKLCPPVQDGWSELFKKLNLSGADIQRFSFKPEILFLKPVPIPPNFFDNMPNIVSLNLRYNKLTSFPNFPEKLTSLNLRSNDLETIPAGALSRCTHLEIIALTDNKIRDISRGAFPDSVEHLELNFNKISHLNSGMFSNLNKLKRLFLDHNKLDRIDTDTFDGLPSLEELDLFDSMMVQFPNFINMPNLVNLSISSAVNSRAVPRQTPMDDDISITTTLAPDNRHENTLVLRNLSSLKNLLLAKNHFTSLPVLNQLPKLVKIDLGSNDLTEIESGAFADLPTLQILLLNKNKLTKFGQIKALSLSTLDLSHNELKLLSNNTFHYMTSLKTLNLADNQIEILSDKTFEPLAILETIDISYNQITFSASTSVGSDPFLGIDWNQSPLRSSMNIKYIGLSHNNIVRFDFQDWMYVFTNIREIDLSFNKIKHVSANKLNFISGNFTLNLENNLINTVDLEMGWLLTQNGGENKIEHILLGGNPLNCDCHAYDLAIWKDASFVFKINNITCNDPAQLKGQKLTSVPYDQLLCDIDSQETGCPKPCICKKRKYDSTVLVNCSSRNLTWEDIPQLNSFNKFFEKWEIELDLSDNQISFPDGYVFQPDLLKKTKIINLIGNNLTTTLFLERVPENHQTTFHLANNPFDCSNCIGFQIPWRAYPTRISDLSNVTCRHSSDVSDGKLSNLVKVQDNSKDFQRICENFSPATVTVILPLLIAVIFLSCLCVGLFVTIRYGWTIKAYLYSKGWDWCLFWERDLDADEETEGCEKLYDAFVSYSHKDEEWVLDELVNKLEAQDGFKLCLHFRDWTPGDWIPDQIVRSVDKSRRTVVVLSKNFVESVWSRLEFKAAHAQALKERSSRVILILLGEDLKESDVQDDDLKMYMKMNTFMKWNDPLFWHRLKYALPHKKPCSQQTDEEVIKQNAINKMQQRDRAIKLDKLRAKLEQNV